MHTLNKDVMVACDFSSRAEVMDFLGLFTEEKPFVKIGMELYYAEGPDIVRAIKDIAFSSISSCTTFPIRCARPWPC